MGFEHLDGVFCKVVAMNVWRHKLVGCFPIFGNDTNVLCTSLIVEYLVINSVAACMKADHKTGVGWDAVSVIAVL